MYKLKTPNLTTKGSKEDIHIATLSEVDKTVCQRMYDEIYGYDKTYYFRIVPW